MLNNLRRQFWTREFALFIVVGCVNTFNGTFLAWLFGFAVSDANLAFNLGYLASNAIAYALNSAFIFPTPLTLARYVKFAVSYIPNYIIQNAIVLVFYNWLGFPPIASYLLAAFLGLPITFLCVKLFAFGRR